MRKGVVYNCDGCGREAMDVHPDNIFKPKDDMGWGWVNLEIISDKYSRRYDLCDICNEPILKMVNHQGRLKQEDNPDDGGP